jgi:hypothetical protein
MTQADGGRSACICRAVERVQLPHYQGITAHLKIARQIANGKSPTQKNDLSGNLSGGCAPRDRRRFINRLLSFREMKRLVAPAKRPIRKR